MDRKQLINVFNEHRKVFFIDASERELENLADHIIAVFVAHYEALEKEVTVSRIERKARGLGVRHHD